MRKLKEMEGPLPRGDQLSRQWRLIQLIDRPQGITVDDAAKDLAVTIRAIWRDLTSCKGLASRSTPSAPPTATAASGV